VYLWQEDADPSVEVGVALHPVQAKVPGNYEKIAKPFTIPVGDLDDFLPRPDQEKVAEIFKNKKDCEIVIHEGQVHGFGSRGDLSIEKDRKAKELCVENVFQFRYLVSDGLDDLVFETVYEVIADVVSLWKMVQIWQFM
jgi:dienelactone hydrolase